MVKIDKKEDANKSVLLENKENIEKKVKEKKSTKGRNLFFFVLLLVSIVGYFFVDMHLKRTKAEENMLKIQSIYDNKINTIHAQLETIENDISNLKIAAEGVKGLTISSVDEKLASLKRDLSKAVVLATAENKNDVQKSHKLAAVEISGINNSQPEEILLASGALIVKGLAEDGLSFEYEAEVLQILAQGNEPAMKYVDILQKYAVSGVTGKNMLIRDFNQIYVGLAEPVVAQVVEISENENLTDLITKRLKELVVLKKSGDKPVVFTAEADEVYDLVNNGDLAEALNKIKISNKYSNLKSSVLDEWIKQVQNYLEFERSINGLIMNSLANIRLKEMAR